MMVKHVTAERLQNMADVKQQQLEALDGRHRGIKAACDWIMEQQQGRFRGRVYGPIALEVNVPNPAHAKFLDQHCSGERQQLSWCAY